MNGGKKRVRETHLLLLRHHRITSQLVDLQIFIVLVDDGEAVACGAAVGAAVGALAHVSAAEGEGVLGGGTGATLGALVGASGG